VIYVALLRGINVGGNNRIAMADLRATLASMGFASVATILQSGNVVFEGTATPTSKLETVLEKGIAKRHGITPEFHVRTADEWNAIVEANPFTAEAKKDPGHLLVSCYKAPLDTTRVKALQSAIAGKERVHADGRHLYMTFPDGIGTSKAAPLVDRMLTVKGTARNWNTVLKLARLVSA
jgi:uncharacterized protein (DUF1697 family)